MGTGGDKGAGTRAETSNDTPSLLKCHFTLHAAGTRPHTFSSAQAPPSCPGHPAPRLPACPVHDQAPQALPCGPLDRLLPAEAGPTHPTFGAHVRLGSGTHSAGQGLVAPQPMASMPTAWPGRAAGVMVGPE